MSLLKQFLTMLFGSSNAPTDWVGGVLYLFEGAGGQLRIADNHAITVSTEPGVIEFSGGSGKARCDTAVQYYTIDLVPGGLPVGVFSKPAIDRKTGYIPKRYADALTGRVVMSGLPYNPAPGLLYLAGADSLKGPGLFRK